MAKLRTPIEVPTTNQTKAKLSQYDLIVIGSGPAGVQAAVQASKLNKSVCIIEKMPDRIGGAWIQTGTLPSKTIRESLEAIHNIRHHAGQPWVERVISDLSTSKLYKRAQKVSTEEEFLVRKYLAKNQIEVVGGFASFEDQNTVRISPHQGPAYNLKGKYFVIATGSRPRRPDNIPFDGWRVVDSDEILKLDCVPKSIVIYGAGVIGCEYACIFSALGVETILADSRDRLMQQIDFEAVKQLEKSMIDMGVIFKLGQDIKAITPKGPRVSVQLSQEIMETDVLFFAAGRISNAENLGLEKLKIEVSDRGVIKVNDAFQTSLPHIYAAGDVVGPPALAATSTQQGRFCALHAFAEIKSEFPKYFPIGVYTIPELSSVGPSEEQLKEMGVDYVVGRAGYGELARGYIRGDHHGLLKLLIDRKTHKILGIHIVGEGAANLVHIGLAFMMKDGVANDLINMIFNYPTLAEAYRIAAFNALNKIYPDGCIKTPKAC
jgi:NAD(P) transhydrogenase